MQHVAMRATRNFVEWQTFIHRGNLCDDLCATNEIQLIINYRQQSQCELCDASDVEKSHNIENAIDGTHSWWQSPTLAMNKEYEFVTIDVDLRQVRVALDLISFKSDKSLLMILHKREADHFKKCSMTNKISFLPLYFSFKG